MSKFQAKFFPNKTRSRPLQAVSSAIQLLPLLSVEVFHQLTDQTCPYLLGKKNLGFLVKKINQ